MIRSGHIFLPLFLFLSGCTCVMNPALNSEVRKTYHFDGQLKIISVYENGKLNGIERRYNERGILIEAVNYYNNKIDGFKNVYYPNGALWRKELYENGSIKERVEFDEEGRVTSQENLK